MKEVSIKFYTRTEFSLSEFCAEEKLKNKSADHFIFIIKRRDFVVEDIQAETIRELEALTGISDSNSESREIQTSSKLQKYEFSWKGNDFQNLQTKTMMMAHNPPH